jgi:hypothetical protein
LSRCTGCIEEELHCEFKEEDKISEEFCRNSARRALSQCTECRRELLLEFKEDRITVGFCEERLCQEGIELVCRESTGKNSFEFWNREVSKDRTFTGLLNTLQAQQGVA